MFSSGSRRVVVLNSYDAIKEAFTKMGNLFSDRPNMGFISELTAGLGKSAKTNYNNIHLLYIEKKNIFYKINFHFIINVINHRNCVIFWSLLARAETLHSQCPQGVWRRSNSPGGQSDRGGPVPTGVSR